MIEKVTVYTRHNKIHHGGALIVCTPTEIPDVNMAKVTVEIALALESVPGCAHRSLRALNGESELPEAPVATSTQENAPPKPKGRPGPKPKVKSEAGADADNSAQSEPDGTEGDLENPEGVSTEGDDETDSPEGQE